MTTPTVITQAVPPLDASASSGDKKTTAPRKRKRLVSAEMAKSRVKTAPLTEDEKLLRRFMRHERKVEEAKKANKPVPEFKLNPEEQEKFKNYVQNNNEEQLKAARRRVTQYNLNSSRTRAKKPLQEIRHFQRETECLNPALPHQHYTRRVYKEHVYKTCSAVAKSADDVHWAKTAFSTLQRFDEDVAVKIIEMAKSLRPYKAGKSDDNHLVTESQLCQAILILGYETPEEQRARLEQYAKEKPVVEAPVASSTAPAAAAVVVEPKDVAKAAKPKPAKPAVPRQVLSKTTKAIQAMKTAITGEVSPPPPAPVAAASGAVAAPKKRGGGGGKKKAVAPVAPSA